MLKTVIFSLQVGFRGHFIRDYPFNLGFWQIKLWHCFSRCLYQIFWIFFRLLDRKFDEDSKNVLTTVIFSLQVGFTVHFILECPFKLCLWQIKF